MKKSHTILFFLLLVLLIGLYARRHLAVWLAFFRLGIEETGANVGFTDRRFEKRMKEIGWKTGDAWCMFYVKLIYLKAHPFHRQKLNTLLNGSVSSSYNNVVNDPNKTLTVSDTPVVGAIVFWTGHAGLVKSVNKSNGTFKTIEGNTSDAVRIKEYNIETDKFQKFAYFK